MADDFRIKPNDIEYDDDVEELDEFDYEGYQVVRREFYAHLFDPAVNFKVDCIAFNTACVKKTDSLYIHIMINPTLKRMLIRECDEDAKDAIKWCRVDKNGKKIPRKILCRMLGVKIFDILGWKPDYKYKIQGTILKYQGAKMILFDLKETEVYAPIVKEEDGKLVKNAPFYPENWRDSFGMSVEEHSKSTVLNMLEGYQRLEYSQRRAAKQKKEDGQASIFDLNGHK